MQTPQACSITNSPVSKAPRGVRKDIGMLMFLLAAETAVVSSISDSPTNMITSAASEAMHKKDVTYSETSSRNGETDSSNSATPTPEMSDTEDSDILTDLRGVDGRQATKLVVIDAAIMAVVLAFVPWKRITRLRGVNKAWLCATESIVQIRTLPGTKTPAAFLPSPKNLDSDKETENALQFIHPSTWRCVVCGFWNAETRVLCGNRQCQCPSLTHAGCARIFLGQLRRDATVPFIQWLISRVIEAPTELRNVENHRHNVTLRGKGCAWAYFKSDDVAQELLAYHRRMFLDSVDGVEGLWIVKDEDVDSLNEVASERGYAAQRPKCLPRNALVVEPPATGSSQMGHELLLSNFNVQCQYAEAGSTQQTPSTPGSFVPVEAPPSPAITAADINLPAAAKSTSSEISISTSYRHDPYSYSQTMSAVPTYPWSQLNLSTVNDDGSSAPPAYTDPSFMSGSYYDYNSNSTSSAPSHNVKYYGSNYETSSYGDSSTYYY